MLEQMLTKSFTVLKNEGQILSIIYIPYIIKGTAI